VISYLSQEKQHGSHNMADNPDRGQFRPEARPFQQAARVDNPARDAPGQLPLRVLGRGIGASL